MNSTDTIRLLCVDDHSFLIRGLQSRFGLEDDFECVGALSDPTHLLDKVREMRPDVVLMDIEMPGPDPFETVRQLHQAYAEVKTVFLSAHVRDHYIDAAVNAGACGFFSKSTDPNTIVDGIRRAATGEIVFGPDVASRIVPAKQRGAKGMTARSTSSRLETLSPREIEVLRLIGRGLTRSAIAETLTRSPKTIDGHREAIMDKLDIHDRAELVRFAIREGLVEP